jgi:hypothetical protein
MYSKRSLVLFAAAIVLLAGAPVARASDRPDARSDGVSERQSELDAQSARSHPTTVRGAPARPISTYGYVPPHRPAVKHRHRINH